jgi:hypothetical protein
VSHESAHPLLIPPAKFAFQATDAHFFKMNGGSPIPVPFLSVATLIVLVGCATPSSKPFLARSDLIAHVRHGDLHFAAYIENDQQGKAFLAVIVPLKIDLGKTTGLTNVDVWAKVKMRDESFVEGPAPANGPQISNAGGSDARHRLQLGDGATIKDVFSVTVSINGEIYELYPF